MHASGRPSISSGSARRASARTVVTGWAAAWSAARSKRLRASATGGVQARSHARTDGSPTSSGSVSTPMRTATAGGVAGSGGCGARQRGVQRHGSAGGADDERLAVVAVVAVGVGVEVQGEAGAGADVDERQRPPGVRGDRGDGGQEVRAAGRLAHLVAVRCGEREQLVGPLDAEGPQLGGEVRRQRRLLLPGHRQDARERLGPLLIQERHHGRDEQQRGQAIGIDARGERQQVGVVAQRREERPGQAPRRRRARAGPCRGELRGLLTNRHSCPPPDAVAPDRVLVRCRERRMRSRAASSASRMRS